MHINLHIHEGLPLEMASEADVQFDIVRGINITLSQHFVVHIVIQQAIQCVKNDMLSVPGHSSKIDTHLIRVRFQDRVQLLLGQAELSRCVNKNQAIGGVPELLHLHKLSVNDEACCSESLLRVRLALKNLVAPISLVLGGTRRAKSSSRMETNLEVLLTGSADRPLFPAATTGLVGVDSFEFRAGADLGGTSRP